MGPLSEEYLLLEEYKNILKEFVKLGKERMQEKDFDIKKDFDFYKKYSLLDQFMHQAFVGKSPYHLLLHSKRSQY